MITLSHSSNWLQKYHVSSIYNIFLYSSFLTILPSLPPCSFSYNNISYIISVCSNWKSSSNFEIFCFMTSIITVKAFVSIYCSSLTAHKKAICYNINKNLERWQCTINKFKILSYILDATTFEKCVYMFILFNRYVDPLPISGYNFSISDINSNLCTIIIDSTFFVFCYVAIESM